MRTVGTVLKQVAKGTNLGQVMSSGPAVGQQFPREVASIGIMSEAQWAAPVRTTVGESPGAQALTEKALFIAVLTGAIDKAAGQQTFNLETAINDLWLKLGNLRTDKKAVGQLSQQMQSMQGELTQILQRVNELNKSMINSLK